LVTAAPEQKAYETNVVHCTPSILSAVCFLLFTLGCGRGLLPFSKIPLSGSPLDNSIQLFHGLLACEVRYTDHSYKDRFQVIFLVSHLPKVTQRLEEGCLPAVLHAISYIWRSHHSVKKQWGAICSLEKGEPSTATQLAWQGPHQPGPRPTAPRQGKQGRPGGDSQVQRVRIFRWQDRSKIKPEHQSRGQDQV